MRQQQPLNDQPLPLYLPVYLPENSAIYCKYLYIAQWTISTKTIKVIIWVRMLIVVIGTSLDLTPN